MRDEYDFSQSIPNPYLKDLPPQVTLQLDEEVMAYFQDLAQETGISSQDLMNLYLKDCVRANRRPAIEWASSS